MSGRFLHGAEAFIQVNVKFFAQKQNTEIRICDSESFILDPRHFALSRHHKPQIFVKGDPGHAKKGLQLETRRGRINNPSIRPKLVQYDIRFTRFRSCYGHFTLDTAHASSSNLVCKYQGWLLPELITRLNQPIHCILTL